MSQIDYNKIKQELLEKYYSGSRSVELFVLPPYTEPDSETLKMLNKYNLDPKKVYNVIQKFNLPPYQLSCSEKSDRVDILTKCKKMIIGEYEDIKSSFNEEISCSSCPNMDEYNLENMDDMYQLLLRTIDLYIDECSPNYIMYALIFLIFVLISVIVYFMFFKKENKKLGYRMKYY